jgi:MFS family permease
MNEMPRRGSLLVIFLTVFIDLLGFGMVLPLLPVYADQFTVDEAGWQLGLLMASFSIMQFAFAPLWGRISDRFGRRPVILIGLAGSVVFYTMFGVATVMRSIVWLFISRIGAGIAGATVPTAQAYIADTTTLETRSKGMALIGMAFGLGFTFGPLLGFLAVPDRNAQPGPGPGYVAALLSALAFGLAVFLLPESSVRRESSTARRLFDLTPLRTALLIPSIGLLLVTLFVCMFSFAGFETTLSLLIKGEREAADLPFRFSWGQVCLTYAYIGFTLAMVQGGIVRRLAGYWREGQLAFSGGLLQIVGFGLVVLSIHSASVFWLLVALGIVVAGVSFMSPNLNSMISRRSDPARQGVVLGVTQSVSSLARILGSALGIPMLRLHLTAPYYVAAGLMGVGLFLLVVASRSGSDYLE